MNKIWNLKKADENIKQKIIKINDAEKLNLNEILIELLAKKNLDTKEKLLKYLYPTRNSFYEISDLPDIENVLCQIDYAKQNNEKITIYGDYDVDGITSSYILKDFLQSIGLDVNVYIPNRLNEGYGLNFDAIKKIAQDNTSLIITVDCGISAIKEIEYANSLGLKVIVTDHHEVGENIPSCVGVIDCKRKDSKYPFSELAGCGTAFKLIMALCKRYNLPEYRYLKYLDIVCIGTIADIVPLIDENRVISKLGLMLVAQTKNLGLHMLIKSMSPKVLDSTTVSYAIAPRINACGRLGDANITLDLFGTKEIRKADEIVSKLNLYNAKRQQIEKDIFDMAVNIIEDQKLYNNNVLIVKGQNWHHGVIGIVASRIVEKYHIPTILISKHGTSNILKGSGRSIKGFNLYKMLREVDDTILSFGGHEMAIGINIDENNLDEFIKKSNEQAKKMEIEKIVPQVEIDMEVKLETLKIEDVEQLQLLEPFGQNNFKPVFLIKNVIIQSIRTLSEDKHLKLAIQKNNKIFDSIGFRMGNYINDFKIGDKIDIVGNLEINEFNNQRNIQIVLKDIRKAM